MITVRLMGGIGNQMFQYAFARRLSHENNLPLKLDIISGFENDAYKRTYALGDLCIQEQFAAAEEIPRCIKSGRLLRRASFLYQSILPIKRRSILTETKAFVFDPAIVIVRQPVYVFGYWQSQKYFNPIENLIRQEFTPKRPLTSEYRMLLKELNESSSVSIHVRSFHEVADATPIPGHVKLHVACSMEYYEQAIGIIKSRINNPRFFIFTDDPIWCKSHLRIPYSTRFVADEAKLSDIEEMHLMSFCHHHIISNSTFGWWGAWLGKNPEKVVVAPARWINSDRYRTIDLFPRDWIII